MQFNKGWEFKWENSGINGRAVLPCVVKGGAPDKILWISNKLPDNKFDYATLFMRTSQQHLKVFIDGKLIYSYGSESGSNRYSVPGSSWHFIKLPASYEGKRIQISLSSPYRQYSGNINSIYIGSESPLVLHVIFQYGGTLITSLLILLLGIILILLYCVLKLDKGRFKGLLYLGTFSFLGGIWIASESKVIQFLLNSPVLLLYIACISLFLLPIPLMKFILNIYKPKRGSILTGFIWAFGAFFIIASISQIFYNAAFMNILYIYHLMLLACIITTMYISIYEMRTGNRKIRLLFLGFIILGVSSFIDLFDFYFSGIPWLNAQGYMQFAVVVFVLLLTVSLGYHILEIYNDQARNEVYKELAYTDTLTGLKNRTSFEEMISECCRGLDMKSDISIIIFDLNNLKRINDSLGHQEGDRLINNASKHIRDCFDSIGEVYRIGGDEFAVVVTEYPEPIAKDKLMFFERIIKEHNSQEGNVEISIAYGLASFKQNQDKDLHSVLMRADGAMYQCKKMQKEIRVG